MLTLLLLNNNLAGIRAFSLKKNKIKLIKVVRTQITLKELNP
jgi:hypothetical protein